MRPVVTIDRNPWPPNIRSSWNIVEGVVWPTGEKMPRRFKEAEKRERIGLPSRQRYARRPRQPKVSP